MDLINRRLSLAEAPGLKSCVRRAGSGWEYRFEGPIALVDAAIEKVFESYHPCGYGTFIAFASEKNGHKNAIVKRAGSCD